MALYIKGMGNISPQQTWNEKSLSAPLKPALKDRFVAIEPDYAQFIDARNIRRMSRIIKMGVGAAAIALKQAEITAPDRIITGTGYGCLDDTGIFLTKMIENKEEALNPTPFIQSTHNTIGSQIALLLQCQGYNQTYAHSAFSFESALLDAWMQSGEDPACNILLGGIDEITDISHAIQSRFGIFRNRVRPGAVNGEGSAFFVMNGRAGANDLARIQCIRTLYKPDRQKLSATWRSALDEFGPADLVLSGHSGHPSWDELLETAAVDFPSPAVRFKELCGEYPVASAFAVWLAASILKSGDVTNIANDVAGKNLKHVMIINQYLGTHFSIISLASC